MQTQRKQHTYQGWKRAVKRLYRDCTFVFYGDKDIGGASLTDPHGAKIRQIAEWDGAEGEVFREFNGGWAGTWMKA